MLQLFSSGGGCFNLALFLKGLLETESCLAALPCPCPPLPGPGSQLCKEQLYIYLFFYAPQSHNLYIISLSYSELSAGDGGPSNPSPGEGVMCLLSTSESQVSFAAAHYLHSGQQSSQEGREVSGELGGELFKCR